MHSAHGAVVLLELLQQRAHSVVENLNDAVVERSSDPGALWMKRKALNAVAFGLEFDEEGVVLCHGGVRHDAIGGGCGAGWGRAGRTKGQRGFLM